MKAILLSIWSDMTFHYLLVGLGLAILQKLAGWLGSKSGVLGLLGKGVGLLSDWFGANVAHEPPVVPPAPPK